MTPQKMKQLSLGEIRQPTSFWMSSGKVGSCRLLLIAVSAALMLGVSEAAAAANQCVNPGGTSGCFATITAAVAAASPNDTIHVAPGTYNEDVVIDKPLSLIGARRSNTIINANGLANGIYIDGLDHAGLSNVAVAGFTIENANFEGILVTNASLVTIFENAVTGNDKSLNPSIPACPGIPDFETQEAFDCGEGIHLSGAGHSTVAANTVEANSGGILISDDTAASHDNLITGNLVQNNPFDCGITLASHTPAAITGSATPLGVSHNQIIGNISASNGLGEKGAGAGIGIFAPGPGTMDFGNAVINNVLTGNGLPGVAIHGHAPGQDLNDNVIVGNVIAGNHADTEDAATPGPTGINIFSVTPITGTIVSQNDIRNEDVDIAVKASSTVTVTLNNLFGRNIGVANLGSGAVDARQNWWGCASGPTSPGCTTVSGSQVLFTPFLTSPFHHL